MSETRWIISFIVLNANLDAMKRIVLTVGDLVKKMVHLDKYLCSKCTYSTNDRDEFLSHTGMCTVEENG